MVWFVVRIKMICCVFAKSSRATEHQSCAESVFIRTALRELSLMMSDFRGDGESEMTQKNRTLEGKN